MDVPDVWAFLIRARTSHHRRQFYSVKYKVEMHLARMTIFFILPTAQTKMKTFITELCTWKLQSSSEPFLFDNVQGPPNWKSIALCLKLQLPRLYLNVLYSYCVRDVRRTNIHWRSTFFSLIDLCSLLHYTAAAILPLCRSVAGAKAACPKSPGRGREPKYLRVHTYEWNQRMQVEE